MSSPAVIMLELLNESRLIPILIKGNETPEMLQLVARNTGTLARLCNLSDLDGAAVECKILSFDVTQFVQTGIQEVPFYTVDDPFINRNQNSAASSSVSHPTVATGQQSQDNSLEIVANADTGMESVFSQGVQQRYDNKL